MVAKMASIWNYIMCLININYCINYNNCIIYPRWQSRRIFFEFLPMYIWMWYIHEKFNWYNPFDFEVPAFSFLFGGVHMFTVMQDVDHFFSDIHEPVSFFLFLCSYNDLYSCTTQMLENPLISTMHKTFTTNLLNLHKIGKILLFTQ